MKSVSASIRFFIDPMKALPVEKLPEGHWLYEIKHDGYRVLAFKDGKDVKLISGNNKCSITRSWVDALKLLPVEHLILDGEIAALDEKGRSSFQLLPRISGSLTNSAVIKMICSESHESLALKAWSPKNAIRFTKAADAAASGSNSRLPRARNL